MSRLIAKVEMVGGGVVVVYCELDKAKAKKTSVKIDVLLWVPGYGCNVVDTRDFSGQDTPESKPLALLNS